MQIWMSDRRFWRVATARAVALAATAAAPCAALAQDGGPVVIGTATLPRDLSPWGMYLNADSVVKAVLIGRKAILPKTHHLLELHRLISQVEPSWTWNQADLDWLSRAAINYRYPGYVATKEQAVRAVKLCRKLREELLMLI